MSKLSFFASYEWKESSSGFLGDFRTDRLYDVCYESGVERLVNDVSRLMKSKCEFVVTFECFTGFSSMSMMRLIKTSSGDMTVVTWEYKRHGNYLANNSVEEHVSTRKNVLRDYIETAVSTMAKLEKVIEV